jgi:uncharacterized protein (DUF1330 family)
MDSRRRCVEEKKPAGVTPQQDDRRIALFEFPSMDSIREFWNSPEYVAVKELRRGAAVLEIWAVPGV